MLTHRFVEFIPEKLEPDVIYVALEFATSVHACCCGCGQEVVTPLSPTGWSLVFNGKGVSLYPSIGNWSLPCRSHYWIRGGEVRWAESWSPDEVRAAQFHDRSETVAHYAGRRLSRRRTWDRIATWLWRTEE